MGAALLVGGLIAGCGPQEPDTAEDTLPPPVAPSLTAVVTNAFEPSADIAALAFAPRSSEPWTGLLAANLEQGGFDIFSVNNGERIIAASGPRLNGLAAAPEFALRGETLPLLFGVDENGELRGFAVSSQIEDVIELPLDAALNDGDAAAACLFEVGIGFVEIAVLGRDAEAEVWRIADGGGETLSVEQRAAFALPFPARACASDGDGLVIAGPASGLARVSLAGEVEARVSPDATFSDVAFSELRGLPAVIAPSAEDSSLAVFDARSLEPVATVTFESGLNAPAFVEPDVLAVSDSSFGGMSFSSGLVAVYDSGDGRVKLVAREVLTRAVFSDA